MIKEIFKTTEKTDLKIIDLTNLLPHEEVIVKRKSALLKYLNSGENIIIPTIVCCKDTLMIIDGHHRYFSLINLGIKKAPVTLIDYHSKNIRTHDIDKFEVLKEELLFVAQKKGKLFPPKTSKHQVKDINGFWRPIILLSTLIEL